MDFITDLSFSVREETAFDLVLVIVNRFTKFIRYITINKTITAEELASMFKKHIISEFNTLNNIVLNRGLTFTSYF